MKNLTVFAALLKFVPMGCKDSVLPELLLNNQKVNCLTCERITRKPYNDNLCLFRAVALHLFGNERLEEEKSKVFKLFLNKCGEGDPSKFQGVHMTDFPKVEEMLQLNIFLYDINFVGGELIGKLVQKVFKSLKRASNFYVKRITFVTSVTWNFFSNLFAAGYLTQSFRRLKRWSDIWLHEATSESSTLPGE